MLTVKLDMLSSRVIVLKVTMEKFPNKQSMNYVYPSYMFDYNLSALKSTMNTKESRSSKDVLTQGCLLTHSPSWEKFLGLQNTVTHPSKLLGKVALCCLWYSLKVPLKRQLFRFNCNISFK